MATTMTPPVEADISAPTSEASGLRFVNLRANLMPDEVIVARRVEKLRRKIVLMLAALVAIMVAGYALSWVQTHSANGDLDDLNSAGQRLVAQQASYNGVVEIQAKASALNSELSTAMANDLPWSTLLGELQAAAPPGVGITAVSGSVSGASSSTGTAAGSGNLNQSGQQSVGTLTITGTAANENSVAQFSDQLGKAKGITAPLITSVSSAEKGSSFSITATITTAALGGRFAASTATPGSTTSSSTPTGGK